MWKGDNIYFDYQMEPMLGLGLEVLLFIGHGKVAALDDLWWSTSSDHCLPLLYLRRCVFNQQTVYSSAAAPKKCRVC